jgi:hypothetical protein
MILNEWVNIKVSNRTKRYFIDMGYVDNDGYYLVHISDINKTNRTKVKCECDYCGVVNDITISNYFIQIEKHGIYSCHGCHFNKSEITFKEKYGVENPMMLEKVKEKVKQTNLEKYGSEYAITSDIIRDKIKETNLEKYGNEYSIASDIVRNKIKETNLNKYGVESIFDKNSPFRHIIENNLRTSLSSLECKEKRKLTNLNKYGVENPMMLEEVKEKSKQSCILKYGVEYALQSEIVKDKSKSTCLEKYGVEYYIQSKEGMEKSKQTRIINEFQIPDENKTDYELYRRDVDMMTRRIKNKLFEEWDGYDYYDNELIIDNLLLYPGDSRYPTIDHKISVYYGFINNMSVDVISNINNLCITKRGINSSKRCKTESEFTKNKK